MTSKNPRNAGKKKQQTQENDQRYFDMVTFVMGSIMITQSAITTTPTDQVRGTEEELIKVWCRATQNVVRFEEIADAASFFMAKTIMQNSFFGYDEGRGVPNHVKTILKKYLTQNLQPFKESSKPKHLTDMSTEARQSAWKAYDAFVRKLQRKVAKCIENIDAVVR